MNPRAPHCERNVERCTRDQADVVSSKFISCITKNRGTTAPIPGSIRSSRWRT
jgi:hypothetical protein